MRPRVLLSPHKSVISTYKHCLKYNNYCCDVFNIVYRFGVDTTWYWTRREYPTTTSARIRRCWNVFRRSSRCAAPFWTTRTRTGWCSACWRTRTTWSCPTSSPARCSKARRSDGVTSCRRRRASRNWHGWPPRRKSSYRWTAFSSSPTSRTRTRKWRADISGARSPWPLAISTNTRDWSERPNVRRLCSTYLPLVRPFFIHGVVKLLTVSYTCLHCYIFISATRPVVMTNFFLLVDFIKSVSRFFEFFMIIILLFFCFVYS